MNLQQFQGDVKRDDLQRLFFAQHCEKFVILRWEVVNSDQKLATCCLKLKLL